MMKSTDINQEYKKDSIKYSIKRWNTFFKIYVIPSDIDQFHYVRKINLSANSISSIPEEFFNMTELKKMNLSHNYIQYLPKEIGKLTKLQLLDIYHNKLSYLPRELFFLMGTSITFVAIDGNLYPDTYHRVSLSNRLNYLLDNGFII